MATVGEGEGRGRKGRRGGRGGGMGGYVYRCVGRRGDVGVWGGGEGM